MHSEASSRVNGRQRSKVILQRIGNRYQITRDDKTCSIGDDIHCSVIKLMFEEPKDLGRVFSEIDGEFQRIEQKGPDEYFKTSSGGRENHYFFDQESMKRAAVDAGLYEFEMRRKD